MGELFEIVLMALACPLILPLVIDDQNEEQEEE